MWHTHLQVTWIIYIARTSLAIDSTMHMCVWHDSIMCDVTHVYVTWLIYIPQALLAFDSTVPVCDMTHPYVTWLMYMGHDSSIYDAPASLWQHHSYMRHDPFICDTTRVLERHDSIICDMTHLHVTRIIYIARASLVFDSTSPVCDMTHPHVTRIMYMGHDSSI